jgi:hypothetical protein
MRHRETGYNRKLADQVYQFELVSFFEPEEEMII